MGHASNETERKYLDELWLVISEYKRLSFQWILVLFNVVEMLQTQTKLTKYTDF